MTQSPSPIGGRRDLRHASVPRHLLDIPLGAPLICRPPLLQPPPLPDREGLSLGAAPDADTSRTPQGGRVSLFVMATFAAGR